MSPEQSTPPLEDPEPMPPSLWCHEAVREHEALQVTAAAIVERVSTLITDEGRQPFLYGRRLDIVNVDGEQVRIVERGFYGREGSPAHALYQEELQHEVVRIEFLPTADDADPEWYTINRDTDNNFILQHHFVVAPDDTDGQWLEWSASMSAADAATLFDRCSPS